jgi:hypothetical protein
LLRWYCRKIRETSDELIKISAFCCGFFLITGYMASCFYAKWCFPEGKNGFFTLCSLLLVSHLAYSRRAVQVTNTGTA